MLFNGIQMRCFLLIISTLVLLLTSCTGNEGQSVPTEDWGVSYKDGQVVNNLIAQDTISDLSRSRDAYHQIANHQEELAHSLRFKLNDSIGNRLVITEANYEELPKTIIEAQAQGYSLLDTLDSEGKLIEAACFAHEDARHYGKRDPKITDEVEWHGAPFLLVYNSSSKKIMGMIMESTSPQPAPPWEYHSQGHPSMEFPHWSLHIWFTDPPENLSLGHHTS